MACSTLPKKTITRTELVKQYPPAIYLEACPRPEYQGNTNGELLEFIVKLDAALKQCNQDKQSLRDWSQ